MVSADAAAIVLLENAPVILTSDKSLEGFLKKLEAEKKEVDSQDEDKLALLQGVVEKILNYVFSAMETTGNRLVNLEAGIGNIQAYLAQQLNDLTGRLRQLPGMQGLKDIQVPAMEAPANPTAMAQAYYQNLAQFIAQKAAELQAMRSNQADARTSAPFVETRAGPDEFSGGFNDEYLQKKKELEAREKYLTRMADQLAAKEQALQERENTIEVLESGLQDKLKISAAIQLVKDDKKAGKEGEVNDELAELSKLSDSILHGGSGDDDTGEDDGDVDPDSLDELLEGNDEGH
ncbi:MAG: hypothetical protein GYA24_00370 [Candidatus Lokiarchaeota archaeon]|nr:hypothetical protein [Candidatus Lokiarchaeota archaeon]